MALDSTLRAAIVEAVKQEEQSVGLSKKIVAWMEAVVSGSEEINDKGAAQRHLELLFEAVEPSSGEEEL